MSFLNQNTKQLYNYKSLAHLPPFPNTDYTEINLNTIKCLIEKPQDFVNECMRLTIGKSGNNFKKITEKYKIAYIYHNKENNTISIWGDKSKFNNVLQEIINHLEWSYNLLSNRN